MTRRCSFVLAALLVLAPFGARAQVLVPETDPMARALAAERRNAFAEAATLFGAILAGKPADAGALFGMERVLRPLDRAAEMLALVQRALTVDSNAVGILQIAVRSYMAAGRPDLARRYTIRWADLTPDDPAPFQEWSAAAAEVRDRVTARAALDLGRQRLADPTALSPDLAQMLLQEGDFAGAAREWVSAVKGTPEFRSGAAMLLGQVPTVQRTAVRTELMRDGAPESRQLLGLVELNWGNTVEGAALIRTALPEKPVEAAALLELAIDALHGRDDRVTNLAKATMLEALAQRQAGAEAARTRLEAARAYADGGAERDARRLLGAASTDPLAPAATNEATAAAMLGVLLAEGKPAEAEKVLQKLAPSLLIDERERETRRLAMAYARSGNFAHAEELMAADSSIAGLDLRGRLRLFAGDLVQATTLLKAAGPYDDEREHAVQRVTLLVMMQSAGADSSRNLGAALLSLERGDSAKAMQQLADLALRLAPAGAAEAHLLAGQLALAARDTAVALRFLRLADDTLVPGVAPAARMLVARITAGSGRADEAKALLERLIVDYPESAVVPEARRFRDALRGAIPGGGQ